MVALLLHRSSRGVLLLLASLISTVDLVWPLVGVSSYLLAVALTVISLAWIAMMLVRSPEVESRFPAPRPWVSGRFLFRLGAVLLLVSLLTAKWLVLAKARGSDLDYTGPARSYTLALWVVLCTGLFARGLRFTRFVALAVDHPARLMALSFGSTGLIGALILSLPFSLEKVQSVSLVDSLFMAFSAVCVTGLSVNNVAETYSLAGQVVLFALIQAGGLGIMVLSAAITLVAGRRMRVKSRAVLAQMVDVRSLADLRRTILMIVVYTLTLEAAGASLLYLEFRAEPEMLHRFGSSIAGAGSPEWAAVFHSVSAFCNAGFSNLSGGLLRFSGSPLVIGTVTALVILGGIGFPVLGELSSAFFTWIRRRRVPTFSLNTRVALGTSGILLGAMALIYLFFEWGASMRALPFSERLLTVAFQSASCRTAGFSLVDVAAMTPAVLVLTCAAMLVGASPGGTGGGIKTTTLAVLGSGVHAELTGRPARLLNRHLPEGVVRRAISVSFLSVVLVVVVFVLLLIFEPHPPLSLMFEVVSAFSTTGLSTGITPELSAPAKLIVTLTMFVGRIGPLTLALALARAASARSVALPEERVMIG